jgi:hypothetical protein
MPVKRPATKAKAHREPVARPSVETLLRRVRRLEIALDAERERHARRLAHVRRAADRRLARMMQEIATLRHHEARAEALARMLAKGECDGQDPRLPG